MKKLFYLFSIHCFGMLIAAATLTSCNSDDDDTIAPKTEDIDNVPTGGNDEDEDEDRTLIVSTSESASLRRLGFVLTIPKGSVPKNNSGADGRVAFSVAKFNELPAPLPEGVEIVNDAKIKLEPMNFVFYTPLKLDIPAQNINPTEMRLLRYDDYSNSWETVPFSSINEDGTVSVSIIELGYFVLVKQNTTQEMGGIHISKQYLDDDYYYYLTLIPEESSGTGIKRIAFAPNGNDIYMANVPLGKYVAVISRELRNNLSESYQGIQYYNSVLNISVSKKLVSGAGKYDTYTGWVEISLPSAGWRDGRPDDAWGTATVTYGTGKFQATLTWVNTSSEATDYDLHLFGPSDIHAYYSNRQSGSFELDRDWLRESGNAIENIYSIDDNFTAGEYTIKVHHYSGTLNRRYNCRIIIDGVVVRSVSGAISTYKEYDDIYSFTVGEK